MAMVNGAFLANSDKEGQRAVQPTEAPRFKARRTTKAIAAEVPEAQIAAANREVAVGNREAAGAVLRAEASGIR